MAFAKKKEEFRIPSLVEASPDYAALIEKQIELNRKYSELNAESSKLRLEIETKRAEGPGISSAVAHLLGDNPVDGIAALFKRFREVAAEMENIESALEILRRRLSEARDLASKVVCHTIRQEYVQRVGTLCDAARALEAARLAHDELLDGLDVEDVRKDYLPPVAPYFLGDRHEGRVFQFLKEVKEAGYNV